MGERFGPGVLGGPGRPGGPGGPGGPAGPGGPEISLFPLQTPQPFKKKNNMGKIVIK